jgi:Flp pilus assembly CpaF family ATPase
VQAHKTIMVVGGTGSGKTTLITSLLENIANTERIITCEDTNEIKLYQPNIVQLEAQSDEGITIRDLIKHCLRLRPDRIIVGEVRGPEAYDMVDSMNTGHPGALFTLHANSAAEGLGRLETLMGMNPNCAGASQASVRKQIASAVDYVIFASRRAGVRGPEQIIALDGTTLAHEYITRIIFDRLQYARGEGEIASPSPS